MQRSFNYLSAIVLAFLAYAVAPAGAATINVTANAPDVLNGGDASCALREAIQNINDGATTYADCAPASGTYGTNDTINLPAGIYTNAIAGTQEQSNADGDLDITRSVTITGAGAATTTIDGSGAIIYERVLEVVGGVVNISGVTIRNGYQVVAANLNGGGGIFNTGTLTVSDAAISGNAAFLGGGIYNIGALTVSNTTISGNVASQGGGIFNMGTLTVSNTTISGNRMISDGGGIYQTRFLFPPVTTIPTPQ